MVLGIDASNLSSGGGVTHIVELLSNANPKFSGFTKVIIWGNQKTLLKIKDKEWLVKKKSRLLERNIFFRQLWQLLYLKKQLLEENCSLLFVPGGSELSSFRPYVTMSRNMLPFEMTELLRYRFSLMSVKLILLGFLQKRAFRAAKGLIFLTHYAEKIVLSKLNRKPEFVELIPHGLDFRFILNPKEQRSIQQYSELNPFKLLYVSNLDVYKHQIEVAETVIKLRNEGYPVQIEFVGSSYFPYLEKFNKRIGKENSASIYLKLLGSIPHEQLHRKYSGADLFIFASSCENMPNILLEAMASGLPIACSNRGPMEEILADGGVYFNPDDAADIYVKVKQLIDSPELRKQVSEISSGLCKKYTWEKCATKTFEFLRTCAIKENAENVSK